MRKQFHYTAEKKVKILREHLDNQVPISELSERYRVHPNMLYKCKKELFKEALEKLRHKHKRLTKKKDVETKALEERFLDSRAF